MAAQFISNTIPTERLLPGLHGLRGVAALSVVLFHLTHLTKIAVPPAFGFIASDFGYSVHLFFILSAYSLMHSTEHTIHHPSWCKAYFIKRYWRIAPLFYFVLLLTTAQMLIAGKGPSLETLILNFSLLFGAAPWTGIVMGGWSVGVEVLFYLIFPVLLLLPKTNRLLLRALLLSILASVAIRSILTLHYEHTVSVYGWNWSYFSFGSNLCFFALGIYAFHCTRNFQLNNQKLPKSIPILTLLILGSFLLTDIDAFLKGPGRLDIVFWGIGFAGLCVWQVMKPGRWCANPLLEYLGERSYSIYLLHPVLLIALRNLINKFYISLGEYIGAYAFFICALFVTLLLTACAELTYRFIEVPGIRHGSRINKRSPPTAT